MVELNQYVYQNLPIRIIKYLGDRAVLNMLDYQSPVVDLGCGPGYFLTKLPSKRTIGIDWATSMLLEAKKKNSEASLLKADSLNLPFRDNSIPAITALNILEHISPLRDYLKEIKRVLKPEGQLIVQIPTEGFLYRVGRQYLTRPIAERITGKSYSEFLEVEHVNTCRYILEELSKVFRLRKLIGIPFHLPVSELNLLLVGKYKGEL